MKAGSEDVALPEGWLQVELGELLRGVDVRAGSLAPDDAAALEVLSLTKNDGLIPQTERFGRRIATQDTSEYKVVRQGQIVYNPYVIWEGAIHGLRKSAAGLVSPVYPVWETTEPDGEFLGFLLRTPPLIEAYNRLCSGAVNRRRSIRREAFVSIDVMVPPLHERRAIATILRTAQRAAEACGRVIGATRQLKQSLLAYLFTYGPIPFDQADQVPLKETALGEMAAHWVSAPVETLISDGPQNGLYKPQSVYGEGTPILRIDDYPNDGGIVTSAAHRVRLTEEECCKYALRSGDLLINRVNSLTHLGKVGLVGRLSETVVFESNLMRFSVNAKVVDSEFLFRFLCVPLTREAMRGKAKRAVAQSSINQGDVRSLIVPLPHLHEQLTIVSHLSAIDAKLAAEEARRANLDNLFKSLLHHLMTGNVRVNHLVDQLAGQSTDEEAS